MIEVSLHPDHETVGDAAHLTLPASRWEILEALAQAGIPSLDDCHIEITLPPLMPQAQECINDIPQQAGFFDALNYFAHCLSDLSEGDHSLLNGAAAIHRPTNMRTMLNLVWHLDSIVVGEAGCDEKLGRFLVENDFVSFPEEALPYLDYARVGERHRASHLCTFAGRVYYEDTDPVIEAVFDESLMCEIPQWAFRAELCHVDAPAEDSPTVTLELPAFPQDITSALADLGTATMEDVRIVDCQSHIPTIQFFKGVQLSELVECADLLTGMDDDDYIKFLAVAEYEHWWQLSDIIPGLKKLADYDFTPQSLLLEAQGSYGVVFTIDPGPALTSDCQMEHQMGGLA